MFRDRAELGDCSTGKCNQQLLIPHRAPPTDGDEDAPWVYRGKTAGLSGLLTKRGWGVPDSIWGDLKIATPPKSRPAWLMTSPKQHRRSPSYRRSSILKIHEHLWDLETTVAAAELLTPEQERQQGVENLRWGSQELPAFLPSQAGFWGALASMPSCFWWRNTACSAVRTAFLTVLWPKRGFNSLLRSHSPGSWLQGGSTKQDGY